MADGRYSSHTHAHTHLPHSTSHGQVEIPHNPSVLSHNAQPVYPTSPPLPSTLFRPLCVCVCVCVCAAHTCLCGCVCVCVCAVCHIPQQHRGSCYIARLRAGASTHGHSGTITSSRPASLCPLMQLLSPGKMDAWLLQLMEDMTRRRGLNVFGGAQAIWSGVDNKQWRRAIG